MLRRCVSVGLVALIGLCILAWPLGRVGLSGTAEEAGRHRSVMLSGRVLTIETTPRAARGPLDRDRYSIGLAPSGGGRQPWFRPRLQRSASAAALSIPIPLVLAGSMLALVLLQLPTIARQWRRRRRGHCLRCGYERAGDAACAECGSMVSEAEECARPRPLRVVRHAGLVVFALLLTLSGLAWLTVERDDRAQARHRARVLDYSWYLDTTRPRLTGAVAVARPGNGPGNLESVLRTAPPGMTVVLLPGEHDLGDPYRYRGSRRIESLSDLWLVGSGAGVTTLSMQLEKAERVWIEGVTVECNDNPFLYLREGGTARLRDCTVRGYNSGAGGSNAIFGVDTVLLIEDCVFDGKSGRAGPGGSHLGNAMDLRGENRVFIRGSAFNHNRELFRDAAGVIDRCTIVSEGPRVMFPPDGNPLYVRGTQFTSQWPGRGGQPFTEALDDPAVLSRMQSADATRAAAWTDPVAFRAATALRLGRGPGLWERLLLHPSAEVRAIARERVRPPALGLKQLPLEEALGKLDSPTVPPEAAAALLRDAARARGRLEMLRDGGTEQERANAAGLLRLLGREPGLMENLEREGLRRPE